MLIGYARVSTDEQNLELQLDALKRAGCRKIYQDAGVSGTVALRPGLEKAFAALRTGDTLVVWRLDRLGRSLGHLIQTIGQLEKRSVHFRSLTETIDTSSSGGRLVFHLMGAMAEFEHALISEQREEIRSSLKRGARPICLAERYGVSRKTIQRVKEEEDRSLRRKDAG